MASKYTKDLLIEAINNSSSVFGVLDYLGLRRAGGTHSHISRKIKEYGLDTSHFLGQKSNLGRVPVNRKTPEDIFTILNDKQSKTKSEQLRRALKESGVPQICSICGLTQEWNGRFLQLEVDHVDGNWKNNQKNNLRFVCPNCHSQFSTSNKPHKYRNL